ncbi:MAG TPA: STAS domain-containing protein [Solirubrobacteraceae bacterium]|jgi:anti-sigma B factor antagonist|nr:STAS domain-containing protein [Solirubrobacteraceae bacterium]
MGFFYISDDGTVDSGQQGNDVVVLVAGGEIDYSASPQLSERLSERIDGGITRVVLDLSTVTFIDSTAIGALVSAATRLRELGGGTLAVVCPEENRRVVRIFEIAGVDSVIAMHGSREDAIAELATVT